MKQFQLVCFTFYNVFEFFFSPGSLDFFSKVGLTIGDKIGEYTEPLPF